MMSFSDWYTDTVDVYRVENQTTNSLTTQQRVPISTGTRCRVYQSDNQPINMQLASAYFKQADRLMCDVGVDIQPGRCARQGSSAHQGLRGGPEPLL